MMRYLIFFCLATSTMHHCVAMKLFSKRTTKEVVQENSRLEKPNQAKPTFDRLLSKRKKHPFKTKEIDTSIRVVIEISSKKDFRNGEIANTTAVDFSHNNLSDLPSLRDYTKLQELDCSHNLFKTISPTLLQCAWLQHLFLQHNVLKTIPDEIQHLTSLSVLNLAHNLLTELPRALGKLKEIKHLNVAHNRLSSVPGPITLLTQLIHLNIKENPINKNAINSLVSAMPHTAITWRE